MKQRIINYLLKRIVRVIIPNDILSKDRSNKYYLGGKLMTEIEMRSLNAEAKTLESMRLWSILNESIKDLCVKKVWIDSATTEHLNISKAMANVLDVQKDIVDKIKGMV